MDKDTRREDESKIYTCEICGLPILVRLPKRLKGFFTHIRCRFPIDKLLESEVIG